MPTLAVKKTGKPKRWRGRVTINGKDVSTKWFGEGTKRGEEYRNALAWEVETRKELLAQMEANAGCPTPTDCSPKGMRLIEWGTAFLKDAETRQATKTFKEKRAAFKRFIDHFRDPEEIVPSLTRPRAMAFLQAEQAEHGNNAANKCRKVLSTAWAWGSKYLDGFPQGVNIFQATPRYKPIRQKRYVPSLDDFNAVLDLTEGQDRTFLMVALHTAARRGELFRLRWADVDFVRGRICLKTMKTVDGSWRDDWLPITRDLHEELLSHRDNRIHQRAGFLFVVEGGHRFENQYEGKAFKSRQHWLKKLCVKAGVIPFTLHAVRHLTASVLYEAGQTVSTIQQVLRHENAQTTTKYLRSLGLEGVRQALDDVLSRGPGKVVEFKKNATG